MRSAPFQRFVVANRLGRLLFLTRIKCCSSRKLSERKKYFENFFDARVIVCTRSMFSAVFGCARSNSIVRVYLRSVKFFRVRAQCCVMLISIRLLRKYVIAHSAELGQISSNRVRLSALGKILSCLRTMLRRSAAYWIPQLKVERAMTCFSDLKNLRSAQNLLIPHENLKHTKRFSS